MKYIAKVDLENLELGVLPIRKGCDSEKCACIGACLEVIGHIKREYATDLLALLNNPRDEYNLGKQEQNEKIKSYCTRKINYFTKLKQDIGKRSVDKLDSSIGTLELVLLQLK